MIKMRILGEQALPSFVWGEDKEEYLKDKQN